MPSRFVCGSRWRHSYSPCSQAASRSCQWWSPLPTLYLPTRTNRLGSDHSQTLTLNIHSQSLTPKRMLQLTTLRVSHLVCTTAAHSVKCFHERWRQRIAAKSGTGSWGTSPSSRTSASAVSHPRTESPRQRIRPVEEQRTSNLRTSWEEEHTMNSPALLACFVRRIFLVFAPLTTSDFKASSFQNFWDSNKWLRYSFHGWSHESAPIFKGTNLIRTQRSRTCGGTLNTKRTIDALRIRRARTASTATR